MYNIEFLTLYLSYLVYQMALIAFTRLYSPDCNYQNAFIKLHLLHCIYYISYEIPFMTFHLLHNFYYITFITFAFITFDLLHSIY